MHAAPPIRTQVPLRAATWNLRGARDASVATAVLAEADASGRHVLLLQDVGLTAAWVSATAAGTGYEHWHVHVHPRASGGVAVAVSSALPGFGEVAAWEGDEHAGRLRVRLRPGWSAAGAAELAFCSVYWPPSGANSASAAVSVLAALREAGADGVATLVAGDVNAGMGSWAAGDTVTAAEDDGMVQLELEYGHAEVGEALSISSQARHGARRPTLHGAAEAGTLVLGDGLLAPAPPTRVAGGTSSHVSHVWLSPQLTATLVGCGAEAASTSAAAASQLAVVASDHRILAVDLQLQCVSAEGGAGPAPSHCLAPAPLPKPTADTEGAFRRAAHAGLLDALDKAYTPALRAQLAAEALGQRRAAVECIAGALHGALAQAARSLDVRGRKRRRAAPRIPAAVVRAAGPRLRAAAAALRDGRPAARAVRAAAAALQAGTMAREVAAASMAAAAQRGTALSALRRTAAGLGSATARALLHAVGGESPAAVPSTLPALLHVPGQPAPLACPPTAPLARCVEVAGALQAGLLPESPPSAVAPIWYHPSAAPPHDRGAVPTLDMGSLRGLTPSARLSPAPPAPHLHDPVSCGEVVAALTAMKPAKAGGPLGLTREHLLAAGPVAVAALAYLFSAVLFTGVAPVAWRRARLLALPKKPGALPTSATGYRPLSLGATTRKVFAVVQLRRLTLRCAAAGVPSDCQHAYVPRRSCATAQVALSGAVERLLRLHGTATIVSLDARKAFDTLPRASLAAALARMGLAPPEVAAYGLLLQRTEVRLEARTQWGTVMAPHARPVTTGVAQGCPCSSLAFVLCMDVVPRALSGGVGGEGAYIGEFADDVSVASASDEGAAAMVAKTVVALGTIGLQLNLGKSQVLRVGEGGVHPLRVELDGDGTADLPAKRSIMLLGTLLDAQGTGMAHAAARAQMALRAARSLAADGLHSGLVPLHLLRQALRTWVEPVLLYGTELQAHGAAVRVLHVGLLRCVCAMLRVPLQGTSRAALVREMGLRVPRASVPLRALGLCLHVTERMAGSAAANGARALLAPGGPDLLAAAQQLTRVGDAHRSQYTKARHVAVAAAAQLSGTPELEWDSGLLPTDPGGDLPFVPWWRGGQPQALRAVLLLRVGAFAGPQRMCRCGLNCPSRAHIVLRCPALAAQRVPAHGLLQAGHAAPVLLHALLGTRPAALRPEGSLREGVAELRVWLQAHPAGALQMLTALGQLCSVQRW